MSLSIGEFYTNTYELSNTNSYSTQGNSELDNQPMEYKTWLLEKLESVGANPTDLADASKETLNQPTIQRILKGTTPNPRIKTIQAIERALINLGVRNANYYGRDDNLIEGESRRIEDPKPIALPVDTSPQPKPVGYQIDAIMAMLNKASPEQLEAALDAVRDIMRVKDNRIPFNGEERRFASRS